MRGCARSWISFGFEYEFRSATECYKSGIFDATLLRVLERYDEVINVVLPTLGPERRATYSPFLPVSPKSGKVLQVPVVERNRGGGHDRLQGRGRRAGRDEGDRRALQAAMEVRLGDALGGAGRRGFDIHGRATPGDPARLRAHRPDESRPSRSR